MAYFPPTGSTVAFQTDATKLAANVSVTGGYLNVIGSVANAPFPGSVSGVGTFNINPVGSGSVFAVLKDSSVAALQGTNPWMVQLTSGSVITTGGNSSVQVNNILTGQASVYLIPGIGVLGSVAALQGTNPWKVELTSGSVITTGGNSSVQVNNILTGQSSVYLIPGVGVLGSVAALQGTNPWVIGNSSVQVNNIATGNASVQLISTSASIAVLVNRILQGVSSVQILTGIGVIGSVAVLQGTNPWVTTESSASIAGTYAEDTAHTTGERGLFTLGVRGDMVTSLVSANLDYSPIATDSFGRTIIKPHAPVEASVVATASTVNAGFGTNQNASVRILAAPGAGLKWYITDFNVSNTGSVATLVTLTDDSSNTLWKGIAPGGGGSNMPGLNTPVVSANANTPLGLVSGTAASIVHIWVAGYKAP